MSIPEDALWMLMLHAAERLKRQLLDHQVDQVEIRYAFERVMLRRQREIMELQGCRPSAVDLTVAYGELRIAAGRLHDAALRGDPLWLLVADVERKQRATVAAGVAKMIDEIEQQRLLGAP